MWLTTSFKITVASLHRVVEWCLKPNCISLVFKVSTHNLIKRQTFLTNQYYYVIFYSAFENMLCPILYYYKWYALTIWIWATMTAHATMTTTSICRYSNFTTCKHHSSTFSWFGYIQTAELCWTTVLESTELDAIHELHHR